MRHKRPSRGCLPIESCRCWLCTQALFRRVFEVVSLPFLTHQIHFTVLQFRGVCVVIFVSIYYIGFVVNDWHCAKMPPLSGAIKK